MFQGGLTTLVLQPLLQAAPGQQRAMRHGSRFQQGAVARAMALLLMRRVPTQAPIQGAVR